MKTKNLLKKRLLSFAALLCFLLFQVLSLASCESEPKVQKRIYYEYFDTVSVFSDYTGMDSAEFSALAAEIDSMLFHYHRLFDIYHEYEGMTNLASLNSKAGEGAVKVDREIIDLILLAKEMHEKTDGAVNIAMGAVISLWHELRTSKDEKKRIPTEEELAALSEHISIDDVLVDESASTVTLLDSEMRLDVGAVAKGFTADIIKEALVSRGVCGAVLDLGGNIVAIGEKLNGDGWSAGIQNPLYFDDANAPAYVRTVNLKDSSFVTSGVYQRYYTVDGKRYHHIIDPKTLMPEYRYLSVTVMTGLSSVADSLSTAFFNMDEQSIREFLKDYPDTEVTLVFSDGTVTVI